MSDLSDLNAAQTVKIVGSDSSGVESNPLQVTTIGARLDTSFATGANTRPSVTSTSSTILASNTSRKYVLIVNQTGQNVYLKLGQTAVASEGILLIPGSAFEINFTNLWTGTINAIKSGGGSVNIEVFEGSI